MAINYSTLFGAIGEYVQRTNDFLALYDAIDTDYGEVEADLSAGNYGSVLEGEFSRFLQMKASVLSWISGNVSKAGQVLTHRENVLEQLRLGDNTSLNQVLPVLYRDMVDNAQTVDKSTVTISAVTDDKANTTAGTVLLGKVLDGYNPPHTSYPVNIDYLGIDSEIANSEAMFVECVTDKNSGATEGSEQFRLAGLPRQSNGVFSWENWGSGNGPSLLPIQAQSVVSNFGFDSFTSNSPNSWTIDDGTAGTHIDDDAADTFDGSDAALKFIGDGTQADIQISQSVTSLTSGRRYCVAVYVKGDATVAAGDLTIQLEGTDYTAPSAEKITMNAAALAAATDYTLKYFFVTIPKEIPSDLKLVIKINNTLTNAAVVRFDYGGMAPVVYFNGIHVNVVDGAEPFVRGDRFTWTVTNDEAGVIQTWFCKAFQFQLPSSGTPTLADTLAT